MRSTRALSITLPIEMADMVRAKVEAGDYASESEVIRDGLRALQARDEAMERWLKEVVVPGHEEFLKDPSTAIPIEDVLGRIVARHKKRTSGV
jgi:antitoxin ParD1/3/4